jgi:hypothetical protein
MKTLGNETKPVRSRSYFLLPAKTPGNRPLLISLGGLTTGAVMWDLINTLYREYCLARLAEMREFELTH